jgi:hypothetical protein
MSNLNWRNLKFIIQRIIIYDHLIVICAEAFLKEDFLLFDSIKVLYQLCMH